MFFSAAQLCKMSAMQICFIRDKPKPAPTLRMYRGDAFAMRHTTSPYVEMQGKYTRGELDIWFTIDEVRDVRHRGYLIEHKMAESAELWLFRSSIMQTAFLGSLASLVPVLRTAKWFDGATQFYSIEKEMHSILNFGGRYYKVTFNREEVMRFFLTKARASMTYDSARQFDATWKFKEWEYLKQFVKFRMWRAHDQNAGIASNASQDCSPPYAPLRACL